MKKTYSTPVMYREAYMAEQYIAASECGTSVGTPSHGHVQVKGSEIHCAFTSSNCGANATSCINSASCGNPGAHQAITEGTNLSASRPSSGHNCHILDTNEDAVYFVNNYKDATCGNGVAQLMGLGSFEEIETAFS